MARPSLHTAITTVILAAGLLIPHAAQAQEICDPAVNHFTTGTQAYEVGSFQTALQSFGCFIERYPQEIYPEQVAQAHNMRGNALRELGDFEGAIAEYTLAIEAEPDYAMAYNNRGWMYFNLNDYSQALIDYNQAIERDSSLAYTFNNRGLIHQFQGNLREAAADFERALSLGLDPAGWAQYNLDLVHLVEGRVGTTLVPAESPSAGLVNEPQQLLETGILAHDAGEWSQTVEVMTEVLASDADNSTALYLRGRAYTALDRFPEALADFDALVRIVSEGAAYPSMEYAYWERAVAWAENGEFERARADANRASLIDPAHVNNFITRGTLAALAGDAVTAGEEFLGLMLRWEEERVSQDELSVGNTTVVEMTERRIYSIPVELEAGQSVTIIAASAQADPVMALLAPDGSPVHGDDDGGFMLSALIEDYEAPVSGTYMLMLGHAGGGSEGSIAVSIVESF